MATISQYAFEDADGAPDTYQTFDLGEALARARRYKLRVIEHTFEWVESEVISDYTGTTEAVGS